MLQDSGCERMLVDRKYVHIARELEVPFDVVSRSSDNPESLTAVTDSDGNFNEDALIVYTSGTTGKPKGVLHTHKSLIAQVRSLRKAWAIDEKDKILHSLPLHHVHGIVNALLCPLYSGASVDFALHTDQMTMFKTFDANIVWQKLINGDITVFMGVPAIYDSLIRYLESLPREDCSYIRSKLAKSSLRLCISGSSALPQSMFEKWRDYVFAFDKSGTPRKLILERYGMTEIGMALGNPLHGQRIPGTVGTEMPGVTVKLHGTSAANPEVGELVVKFDCIFKRYINRPEEMTSREFVQSTSQDGETEKWFKTGDLAMRKPGGYYQILGRMCVDILKVRGFKVSALEIEQEIMKLKDIGECAVVSDSIPDPNSGDDQIICVLTVPSLTKSEYEGFEKKLKLDLYKVLAHYKIPRRFVIVDKIPRNALGKVNKKTLLKDISVNIEK